MVCIPVSVATRVWGVIQEEEGAADLADIQGWADLEWAVEVIHEGLEEVWVVGLAAEVVLMMVGVVEDLVVRAG